MAFHRASVSGSLAGRLAFIGKSVRGRLTVSFHSGMRIRQFYNEVDARNDARQRTESDRARGARGAARVGLVLVPGGLEGRTAGSDRRLSLGGAHEFQG